MVAKMTRRACSEQEAVLMFVAAEEPDLLQDEQVDAFRMADSIENVLATLKEQEADVIRMRFGLGCEPQTLARIGQKYGVQGERIRQIEARALRRIRSYPWRNKILKPYWLDKNP